MNHGFLDRHAYLDSPAHRLDACGKIILTLCFAAAVVSTPAEAGAAFLAYALLLAAVLLLSRLPLTHVLVRLAIVLPFVAAVAVFIPFLPAHGIGGGYNLGLGGLRVSHAGLLVFRNVLAKALLGAAAVILLTSTTPFPVLLQGLARLRVPRVLLMLLSFAYRYIFVLVDEAQRMKRARDSRCYSGQWLWQASIVGRMIGTLFLRSYERGERVYLAMLARGYDGIGPSGHRAIGSSDGIQNAGLKLRNGEAPGAKPAAKSQEPAWAIEVTALSYAYPDGSPALHELTFSIAKDERLALVGPNGAGKSTLLLHLNGILQSAAVKVAGLPVTRANLQAVRRKVGLVFQDPDDQLFCPTVFEDVAFGPRNLRLNAAEVEQRVRAALRGVGLEGFEQRGAFHLSVGQKKRAALATVLAMQPEILALDEPTSNLDRRGRRELIALLKRLSGTQVIATHDLELAAEVCGRVIVLEQGRVVAHGDPRTVLSDQAFLLAHGLA